MLSHYRSIPSYSSNQWDGSKPQKFKGGRRHDNHPTDELDNLLMGCHENQSKPLGPSKKRFQTKMTIGSDEPPKPHIRTNGDRNESNVVFSTENIPKLIKIPPPDQFKNSNSILFRNSQIGESKLKNLQTGQLKTGIYRNFYKSQFKEQTMSLF